MNISIDATNLKDGGGLTHLKRILDSFDSQQDKLTIIGGEWIKTIKERENIQKIIVSQYFTSLLKQEYFKFFILKKYLAKADIAFIPGGAFSSNKLPYVTMSQNMLVFENVERNRFFPTLTWLRYLLLEIIQLRSFRKAKGIIYISNYAKNYIENKYPDLKRSKSIVIYHGISDDFRKLPEKQKGIAQFSKERPLKISYVSIINHYKHQWNVIEAVKLLREEGLCVELELVGPLNTAIKRRFEKAMNGAEEFIRYKGRVPYEEIKNTYKNSDLFIFASTCENMPNILIEAMSAGLPILSSNYGPMPEILRDGGIYMDPTDVNSIYTNLKTFLLDKDLRQEKANKAFEYSKEFSWEKTATQTFDFIRNVVNRNI